METLVSVTDQFSAVLVLVSVLTVPVLVLATAGLDYMSGKTQ